MEQRPPSSHAAAVEQATTSLGVLERLRLGDREAFRALIDKYGRRLAARIHFRMGPRLREHLEPDDVFQMVCLRAYQDLHAFQYTRAGCFYRWLCTLADHVLADEARYEGRQKRNAGERLRFGSASLAAGPDPADFRTPSRLLAEDEGFRRLLHDLESLPEDYRTALILAKLEGLTVAEVAGHIGRTREATAVLIHRAIRRLRQLREGTAAP